MASTAYIFGEKAAQDIADVVRRVNRLPGLGETVDSSGRRSFFGQIECGTLNGTMARSGTQTMSIIYPATSGGVGSSINVNLPIVDFGLIPAASSPLPNGTKIQACYCRGAWVLSAYDCDSV